MYGRLENELKIKSKTNEILLQLPDHVSEWNINLIASQKTASSCSDFVYKIRNFLKSIDDDTKNIKIENISINDVERYFISIQTKVDSNGRIVPTSDSYQQGVWCALNSFFDFLVKRNYIKLNYIKLISKPKNRDLQRINDNRILLTKEDFKKILDTIEDGFGSNRAKTFQNNRKTRDTLILLLFMTTGMRKTALSEINISDINFDNYHLKIIDKGNKTHEYILGEKVQKYLSEWLYEREEIENSKLTDALFISSKGNRLTGYGVYEIVTKYCDEALGYHISPHKLRSGFCSILYNQTKDVEFVRRAVGHTNVSTTQRYIVTNNNEKEVASNIFNNLLN